MLEKIFEWLRFQILGCRIHEWRSHIEQTKQNDLCQYCYCLKCNKKVNH